MRSYLAMKRSFTWFAVIFAAACQSTIPASAPITRERIAEIVASPDRSDADRTNDRRRKPELMLGFIGVRPGMVAMDLSAGGGYTTELIARAAGPGGKVYGQSAPPDPNRPKPPVPEGGTAPAPSGGAAPAPAGPRLTSAQRLAERMKNPAAGNIVPVVRAFEDPAPPELAANALDLVSLMFNYHDLGYLGVNRSRMNRAAFAALKPGECTWSPTIRVGPAPVSRKAARCTASRRRWCDGRSKPPASGWSRRVSSCAIRPTRATGTRPTRPCRRTSSS